MATALYRGHQQHSSQVFRASLPASCPSHLHSCHAAMVLDQSSDFHNEKCDLRTLSQTSRLSTCTKPPSATSPFVPTSRGPGIQGVESRGARKSQDQTSGSWDHTYPHAPSLSLSVSLQKGLSSPIGGWALSLDKCCSLHNGLGVLPSPDPFLATHSTPLGSWYVTLAPPQSGSYDEPC